jgi:hypothetical protein
MTVDPRVFVHVKVVARWKLLTTPGTVHACTAGSPWRLGGAGDLSAGRGGEEEREAGAEQSDAIRHGVSGFVGW